VAKGIQLVPYWDMQYTVVSNRGNDVGCITCIISAISITQYIMFHIKLFSFDSEW
jgi:hypothetical protein